MALPTPPSPIDPIPNTPFFYPTRNYVQGEYSPFTIGSGLELNPETGVLSATSVAASLAAGTGISLVTAGSITTISNTGIISLTGDAPISITSGTTPVISVAAATTSSVGVVQLNDTVTSTSTTEAATANAVKTAYDAAINSVQSVSGTVPVQIDVTDPQNPVISVGAASTTAQGIVQLNDTTSSTSVTEALTANQGRALQEEINALAITSNLTFAGTIDGSTGLLVTVSNAGALEGFVIGDPLPAAASSNLDYFVIVTVSGTMTPPGGVATLTHLGDWFLSDGTAWQFLNVGYDEAYASTTAPGIVQLATDAEVQAGVNTNHAVVPSALQSKMSDSTSTTSSTTIASSTAVKAAYDLADAAVPDATFTAKGDILTGTGAGTYSALPVGTDGSFLVANSAATEGVCWTPLPAYVESVTGTTPITVDNTDPQNPIVGVDAASTTASGVVQLNDTVTSTSTTEAATANAVKCAYDIAAAAIPCSIVTAKGSLIAATGAGLPVDLPVGTDGQILYACSTAAAGVCWAALPVVPSATPLIEGIVFGCTPSSGCANVALGQCALRQATADFNTAIGFRAACNVTTGQWSTVVGAGACMSSDFTESVFVGTFGNARLRCQNVAIGIGAGGSACAINTSVFIGGRFTGASGSTTFSICDSVHIGNRNASWSGGNFNVAIGACAYASSGTTPIPNSCCNVTVGWCGLSSVTTGSSNVALGARSGGSISTGSSNVLLGAQAGQGVTTGACNVFIGPAVGSSFGITDSCTLRIGYSNTCTWICGLSTKAIKPGAGIIDCSDTCGTAGQVLASTGTNGIVWTTLSFIPNTTITAKGNLIVGTGASTYSALPIGTNGQTLIADSACSSGVKWADAAASGITSITGTAPIAIDVTTPATPVISVCAASDTDLGVVELATNAETQTGTDTTRAVTPAGLQSKVASTTALGIVELATDTETQTGTDTTRAVTPAGLQSKISDDVLTSSSTTIASSTAVCCAYVTAFDAVPCSSFTAKGDLLVGTGVGGVHGALAVGANTSILVADSACLTGMKWSTLPPATPTCFGTLYGCIGTLNTMSIGFCALAAYDASLGGLSNVTAIGTRAMAEATCVRNTVAIGFNAACSGTGTALTGDNGVFIGTCAGRSGIVTSLNNTAIGFLAMGAACCNAGNSNIAIGTQALGLSTTCIGQNNVVIGAQAGQCITGNFNTVIGSSAAGSTLTTGANNLVLGCGASTSSATVNNTVTLGNSSITTIRAQVTTITSLSDERDKTDIVALPLGLDFVNSLKPVKFTWQMREPNEVKDGTSEAGFIAQDLQVAQDAANAAYLGLVYDDNPEKLEASPGKLIPVLVRAIQELSAEVQSLKAQLNS